MITSVRCFVVWRHVWLSVFFPKADILGIKDGTATINIPIRALVDGVYRGETYWLFDKEIVTSGWTVKNVMLTFPRNMKELIIIDFIEIGFRVRCWRSKDKLISDILLGSPVHVHRTVDRPGKTNKRSIRTQGAA